MDWKDWYFARAKVAPSPLMRRLFWDEIKPGCSKKQLGIISKSVLDIDDPTKVDWTRIRAGHLYLRRDAISQRAALSAMSNITRLMSKGLIARTSEWFREFSGWKKKAAKTQPHQVVDEETFRNILEESTKGMPDDVKKGTEALLCLAYYCGLKTSQAGLVRQNDFLQTDGRLYLYKVGRLIELPDHVRSPIHIWLRARKLGKAAGPNPALFRQEHRKILSKYPRLYETYASLRRMRG